MSKMIKKEKTAADCYRHLAKTAKRFHYEFQLPAVRPGEPAIAFFVGNHSSGKSTYINYLMEGAAVQDTGVAPTDDGFTVLKHAEEERDVVGPAALSELGPEFARLGNLGPKFLERLRVRYRNRPMLLKTILIDSPGMLDATERKIAREYDFFSALSIFAEAASMIIVLFDPEKPGTTGETIDALSGPLADKVTKLHIVMNRCDQLSGVYDYGRAYGSLCWNLAHAMQIKDLPKIYPCRVPTGKDGSGQIDTAFMDAARDEMSFKIKNAAESRASTVVESARNDLNRLLMQIRMVVNLGKPCFRLRLAVFAVALAVMSFLGFRAWPALPGAEGQVKVLLVALVVVVVSTVTAAFVSKGLLRMLRPWLSFTLDSRFESEYHDEFVRANREDLRQYWEQVRPKVKVLLASGWKNMPSCGYFARRRVIKAISRLSD